MQEYYTPATGNDSIVSKMFAKQFSSPQNPQQTSNIDEKILSIANTSMKASENLSLNENN